MRCCGLAEVGDAEWMRIAAGGNCVCIERLKTYWYSMSLATCVLLLTPLYLRPCFLACMHISFSFQPSNPEANMYAEPLGSSASRSTSPAARFARLARVSGVYPSYLAYVKHRFGSTVQVVLAQHASLQIWNTVHDSS